MPVVSTAVMGILIYLMHNPLNSSLGNTKATLACVAGAIIVYVLMLFVTGSLRKEDMKYIPGGRIVTRFMSKLGFWE